MEVKKHYTTLTKSETNTAAESLVELIVQHMRTDAESQKREPKKLLKSKDNENPSDESSKPI